LIAFADFGNVTFTDCVAATAESSEGVDTATVMDIENTAGEVLTDTSLISDSSFEVSYTTSSTSASGSGTGTSGSGSGNGGGKGRGKGFGNSDAAGGFGSSRLGNIEGFGSVKRWLLNVWTFKE
jgi:hypothetical protein